MPLLILLLVSGASGAIAWAAARAAARRWWARTPEQAVAAELREHPRALRRFVHNRADAEVLSGLALTLAFGAMIVAGVVVAALAVVIRRSELLHDLDAFAANGAHHHVGPQTRRILEGITFLASTQGVILVCVIVGIVEYIRLPNRWIPVFLIVVTIGDSLITNAVKNIVDRARPAIEPVAATLGPSFPSGHSSTAAAYFAALALVAGRRRSARTRALLAGVAVGLAVAVACSRVLLDLHWVSDVVAGLALGWGWFAACAIVFGGWFLRFGDPVERAAAQSGSGASARGPAESTRVCRGTSASASEPGSAR